ncbi:MFS transporter [Streptomyces sp. T-3]|nr:MFS transporter [Streptomyces sp. T-3]
MSFRHPRFPGERALVTGISIDATGSGMYVPFTLVFFLHVTGLPLGVIGVVLTVTGLAAIATVPLAGTAVDLFGAKRVQLFLYLLRAVSFALFPLADQLPTFATLALLTAIGTRAFPAVLQARIAELVGEGDRDRMQALQRSLGNAGLGAGTLLASLLIGVGGDSGYAVAAWLNAVSFLLAALLALRTPSSPLPAAHGRAARPGSYRLVVQDRPFLALVLANVLVALGYTSLTVLLPVYSQDWLKLPGGLTGVAFVVNTALCATLGVPVGALVRHRFTTRSRAAAAGAGLFVVSFLGLALTGVIRPHNVSVLLGCVLAAVIVLTMGELVHSPAAAALTQAVAPPELRGRYMAAFQLSWSLAYALTPALFTLLLSVDGRLPWLFAAVTSLLGGALLLRVERSLAPEAVRFPPKSASALPA